jgi:hypothetical protein
MNPIGNRGETSSSSCDDVCQAAATAGNSHGKSSSSGGGSASGGGNTSTPGSNCSSAQPVKKHWWQRGGDWIADNKNMLIGAAAGIGTFIVCDAMTVGVGSIGCMAAAGAVGKLTTDSLNGDIHSASDVAESLVTGAVEGAIAAELAAVDLVSQGAAVVDDVKHGDYAGAAGRTALGALDALTIAGGVKAAKGANKGVREGGGCNSFTAATPVLLANGTNKPISDIKLGDTVLATDPETDTTHAESNPAITSEPPPQPPPSPWQRYMPPTARNTCTTSPSTTSTRTMYWPATHRYSYTTRMPPAELVRPVARAMH